MPQIFAHSDKNVRAEGTALVLALHTYLGVALAPSLAELKPVQQTELQKSFEALDAEGKGAGTGKPTRYTRKEQRRRDAAVEAGPSGSSGSDGAGAGGDAAEPEAIDPRSLLDPVNVLDLFPSDLEERLSSTKWKDRLESLEDCNKVLSAPQNGRIAEANVDAYSWLTTTLGAKCKSDANVNVVMEAAKVIEGLARGFGKPFSRHRGAVMPGCLERLKERKANVTDALGKALDAVFSTVSAILIRLTTASLPDFCPDNTARYRRGRPDKPEIQEPSGPRRNTQVLASIALLYLERSRKRSNQAPRGIASLAARRQRRTRPRGCGRVPRHAHEDCRGARVQPLH